MSLLLLVVLVAGVFALAPTANADVPDCECTTINGQVIADGSHYYYPPTYYPLVSCPGAWGLPGHTPGSETDWVICLYDDNCVNPLVGFDCLRLKLEHVLPDSICVCDEECTYFPYIYPEGPTAINGCTSFRFRGTILALDTDIDPVLLQICGCQDLPLFVRSPDVNADCAVGLTDFVIFSGAFGICPPEPTGLQHYTIYTGHTAPCPRPGLSDFVVFVNHWGHSCTHVVCDP